MKSQQESTKLQMPYVFQHLEIPLGSSSNPVKTGEVRNALRSPPFSPLSALPSPPKCSSWPGSPLLTPLRHERLLMAKILLCPRSSRPGTQWAPNMWWMDQWERLEEGKVQVKRGKTQCSRTTHFLGFSSSSSTSLCLFQQIFFEHLPHGRRMKEARLLAYWDFETGGDRAALSPLFFSEDMVRLCRCLKEVAAYKGSHSPQP